MGGVDKGLQPLHGRPMVEHVLARLAPQVDEILINANQNLEAYAKFGHRVVPDAIGGFAGPLAGLHAGLAAASQPLAVTVPCDSPFLPLDLVARLRRALEIDSASLLKEPGSSLEKRIKTHAKRTDNYAYKTLTPGAENKHLKAFRVVIDAQQEHKGAEYHHEGEEFDYVLTGKIQVTVGNHVNTLAAGDCLHFNSGIPHKLKSISDERAELIVVIYTP